MKKLLHVIDSLGTGGAENLLVNVINSLQGYEQHLVIMNGPVDLRDKVNRACHFLNLECGSKLDVIRAVPRLRRYIRESGIDIVHSHLYLSNIVSRLATPKTTRVFNSVHAISSLASYKVNRLSLYVEKATYRQRHVIIAVSKAVLDDFSRWVGIKGQSLVLYNFIDENYFRNQPRPLSKPGTLRLVAVGNLRWQKNYEYLLESFKALPPQVHLDIYGEGQLREKFEKIIRQNNLNITLMGLRNGLENILPQYDAFVMSSLYEGQPLSLLEATASGLPSLLSDIPVLREILGESALYFDINDPGHFARLITDILNDRYDLAGIAGAAYKKIDGFAHQDQYLQRLYQLYEGKE